MTVDPIIVGRRLEAARAELDLVVPKDLLYFEGHFPGAPVVPGVVQIKWAIAFGRELLRAAGGFAGAKALKFQHALQPGSCATLRLDYAQDSGELKFVFESEGTRYSSGRLRLRVSP